MSIQPLRDRHARISPFEVTVAVGLLACLCFAAFRAPGLDSQLLTSVKNLMSGTSGPDISVTYPTPRVR